MTVLVGVAAGAIFAFVWFGVCTWLRSSRWLEWGLDTKVADGPALHFTREEWTAFVAGVKAGEFDVDRTEPRESSAAQVP